MNDKKLAVLLACFSERDGAGRARRPLDEKLRSAAGEVLDTAVLKVNEKHKASVHDPRRVLMGTLTPALTWGLFGLLTGGWRGLLIWAVVGAVCGAPYTYWTIHHATKAELEHIGNALPEGSSALLTFAESADPAAILAATSDQAPSVASLAAIDDDLTTQALRGQTDTKDDGTVASMIIARYPDTRGAARAASRIAGDKKAAAATQVELVVRRESDGRWHVADPKFGVASWAKNQVISWGLFGLVVGAISGASGGGIIEGGLVTGILWGIFGIFAGSLYGLLAGRSVSGRRLKGAGLLLTAGTSLVLAWADGQVSKEALDEFGTSQSQRVVLHFNSTGHGAVIDAG